ncbi:MAG: sigma-70 family RNA polymerase sigma factor [Deinococcales bacterium]
MMATASLTSAATSFLAAAWPAARRVTRAATARGWSGAFFASLEGGVAGAQAEVRAGAASSAAAGATELGDADAAEGRLVAAAKYGDPDAFDALAARHAAALHAVARRLVGDALARDVVQDSLLAAYSSVDRFRGEASFGSYLHGIVVNRCRRLGRRRRFAAPEAALLTEASREPGPEDRAVTSDTRRHIEAALATLPRRFREALALREFGELSYGEIAGVVGVPLGTVRSRIARARRLLRDELERRGVQP